MIVLENLYDPIVKMDKDYKKLCKSLELMEEIEDTLFDDPLKYKEEIKILDTLRGLIEEKSERLKVEVNESLIRGI